MSKFLVNNKVIALLEEFAYHNESSITEYLIPQIREEWVLLDKKDAERISNVSLSDIVAEQDDEVIELTLGREIEDDLAYIATQYDIPENKAIALIVYHLDEGCHGYGGGKRYPCHRKKCVLKKKSEKKLKISA